MHLMLWQPQIPQNTGNIVRTCHVTGSRLTLVPPLGFSTSDRQLKRAGLDYWEGVQVHIEEEPPSEEAFAKSLESLSTPFYFFSSHAQKSYTEIPFQGNETLIFGAETTGLPDSFFQRWPHLFYTIPMVPGARCLNLATSVGIVLYEGIRQVGLPSAPSTP